MEPSSRQRPSRLVVALLVVIIVLLLADGITTVALLSGVRTELFNVGLIIEAALGYGPCGA